MQNGRECPVLEGFPRLRGRPAGLTELDYRALSVFEGHVPERAEAVPPA